MGYRSDVKIVFYLTKGTIDTPPTEDKPLVPFPMLKLWFDENYPVMVAKDEWGVEIEHGDDYILLNYRDVKWYESYVHPQDVEKAFANFSDIFRSDELSHRAQYEIVRLGENDDDIERECSGYADHRLCVTRDIVFE